MNIEKENFLRTKFVRYLQQMDPALPPKWGRMNLQQMIEHFADDALCVANGKLVFEKIITPPDQLARMRSWLMSPKPFRENIKNPLLPEDPRPTRFRTRQAAIGNLQAELIDFFEVFEREPLRTTRNPFYGDLNFEENLQLLFKHAIHHLRQFGVVPPEAYNFL